MVFCSGYIDVCVCVCVSSNFGIEAVYAVKV